MTMLRTSIIDLQLGLIAWADLACIGQIVRSIFSVNKSSGQQLTIRVPCPAMSYALSQYVRELTENKEAFNLPTALQANDEIGSKGMLWIRGKE